jgi:alpha-L-fucosidase
MELYYSSVGRNSNLLLNVPPDRRGLLNENDVKSLMLFRQLLKKEFETDLARGMKVEASSSRGKLYRASNVNDGDKETYWTTKDSQTTGDLIINLNSDTELNRVVLQEYIKLGQRVQQYTVSAFSKGEWKTITEGTTIGHKVIRKFPVIKTSKIKVTITKSKACPLLSNIELYRAPGD